MREPIFTPQAPIVILTLIGVLFFIWLLQSAGVPFLNTHPNVQWTVGAFLLCYIIGYPMWRLMRGRQK